MSSGDQKRRALAPNAKLDSFYNINREVILTDSSYGSRPTANRPNGIRDCRLFCPYRMKRESLLDVIGIGRDLVMSLLLNLIPILGIASVLNHRLPFDTNTRILYYSAITHEKRVNNNLLKRLIRYFFTPSDVTHRISAIEYGIDILIIWQLPSDGNIECIDESINRIADVFSQNGNLDLAIEEQQFLDDNNVISTIYSNIEKVHEQKDFQSVCHLIKQMNNGEHDGYPVNHILTPKYTFRLCSHSVNPTWTRFDSNLMNQVYQNILRGRQLYDQIQRSWNQLMATKNHKAVQMKAHQMRRIFDEFRTEYTLFTEHLKTSVLAFRKNNRRRVEEFPKILDDASRKLSTLEEYFNYFQTLKENLLEIIPYITQLKEDNIEFQSIHTYQFNQQKNLETIEDELFNRDPDRFCLCANDNLLLKNPDDFRRLRNILVKERDLDRSVRLVYLDFTDFNIELKKMHLLPSDIMEELECGESDVELTNEPMINVLLLGETGVGKSTFINALRNYMEFPSIDDAIKDENPIVVIPIYFITTSGYDFTEHVIKFENTSNSNNENFNKRGESVTQKCQDYIFDFSAKNQQKIRIIDTPGFNDTRGLKQDRKNRRNILKYIRRYPHIDAICFLLKPNESRLTIAFRLYFTAFAAILDKIGHRNVMFCYTNSRATFYAPGNTGPILKEFLSRLKPKEIQMEKRNTFCFDNESFRYFVLRRNGLTSGEENEKEYRESWRKSCDESNRLIESIYQSCRSEEPKKAERV